MEWINKWRNEWINEEFQQWWALFYTCFETPNASLELFVKKKTYILPNGKSQYWVKFQPLRHCEGSEQAIYISKFMVTSPEIPSVAVMWYFQCDHVAFRENAAWK